MPGHVVTLRQVVGHDVRTRRTEVTLTLGEQVVTRETAPDHASTGRASVMEIMPKRFSSDRASWSRFGAYQ